MQKNKSQVLDFLSILENKERKEFSSWLNHPLHNTNKRISALGKLLIAQLEKDHPSIDKRDLFEQLYDQPMPYDVLKINNLFSDLQKQLVDYISWKQHAGQDNAALSLANHLLNKGYKAHLRRIAQQVEIKIHKRAERSEAYYLQQKNLSATKDHIHLAEHPHAYSPALQAEMEALDQYYWLAKLKLSCEMISRSQVIQKTYTIDDLSAEIEQFRAPDFSNVALHIYAQFYHLLKEKKETLFFQIKASLLQQQSIFPESELRVLYNYLLNFCINKVNSGKSAFYREILAIYQEMLLSGMAFQSGYISEWTFKNIVTTAIRLKEYNWTEDFISLYQKNLPAADRENAVAYNKATLYLAKNDFSNSLQSLIGVEFTDATYFIGARLIQIKSYYGLEEYEALISLFEAFGKYIKRNKKLSPFRKQANDNFLKMAKKLVRLKSEIRIIRKTNWRSKAKTFEQKLDQLSPITNKDWLMEEYELLKKAIA